MQARLLSALAVVLVAAGSSRADVLDVYDPPSLPGAVAAAQEGDVVILHVGMSMPDFRNILIDGKGIALVAEPAGLLWFGGLTIRNVPAGSTTLVSGFAFSLSTTVVIAQNAGAVRIQDCSFAIFGTGCCIPFITRGVECTACADLAFLRCSLRGRNGGVDTSHYPFGSTPGLRSVGCTLAVQDSLVLGGRGWNSYFGDSGPVSAGGGSAGIALDGGQLVLQSSQVQGGAGGTGMATNPGGPGGPGVAIGGAAVARAVGGRTLGGLGGDGGTDGAPDGPHGVAVDVGDGTWSLVQAPLRSFVAPSIAYAGAPLPLTIWGAPGEHAFVAGSAGAAHAWVAALDGAFLLRPPMRRMGSGFIGAANTLDLTLVTPGVPGGAPNGLLHLQPVSVDALGNPHLGCAQVVVLLP